MSNKPIQERNAVRYINKLSNILKRKLDVYKNCDDLTGTQGLMLRYILSVDHYLCQKELEAEFEIRPASASELLDKLEKKGYIVRKENEKNRRMKYIMPTPKAIEKKDLVNDVFDLNAELTNGLDENQYEQLLDLLEALLENVEKK